MPAVKSFSILVTDMQLFIQLIYASFGVLESSDLSTNVADVYSSGKFYKWLAA